MRIKLIKKVVFSVMDSLTSTEQQGLKRKIWITNWVGEQRQRQTSLRFQGCECKGVDHSHIRVKPSNMVPTQRQS